MEQTIFHMEVAMGLCYPQAEVHPEWEHDPHIHVYLGFVSNIAPTFGENPEQLYVAADGSDDIMREVGHLIFSLN